MNENVEITRSIYEKFSAGDIEGLLGLLSDDSRWTMFSVENSPYKPVRNGKEEVREFFRELSESEEAIQMDQTDYIGSGDRVVVLGSYAATVRATGRRLQTDFGHVWKLENRLITGFQGYWDTAAIAPAFQKAASA